MKIQSKIVKVTQGSPEWHQHRATHCNASELASAMGLSSYISRSELIDLKATGVAAEIDSFTQSRFDAGHAFEAQARPWAEVIIGEELFPTTLAAEVDGLNLSASLDGQTMTGEVIWEHKTLNDALRESLSNEEIPEQYHPQLEQGLMLSGADRCLFMASDGDEKTACYAWYESSPELRAKIIPTWKQLRADVANYTPSDDAVAVDGKSPDHLPALHIEVKGAVTASNLVAFKSHALAVFDGIKTDLQTDSDFADAEKTVKWCSDVESKLDAAKEHALAQTASIDELFKAIDSIKEEARSKRLTLDKLIKSRKEAIRREIVADGKSALLDHVTKINSTLDLPIQVPAADFAAAIKGKRTISSLRDAVDTLLAQSKIESNATADLVRANLKVIADAGDYSHLFADRAQLVTRETDYVQAIVSARIAEHKAAEQKRIEVERERIREEEQRKAELAAKLKAEEQRRLENLPKQIPEESKSHAPQASTINQIAAKSVAKPAPTDMEILGAVALHFRVHESKALEWLIDLDVAELSKQVDSEFAA